MSEATVNPHDEQYMALVGDIMQNGASKDDRTGTGTISSFGHTMRFDLGGIAPGRADQFPLLTVKHTPMRLIAEELFWFIQGGRPFLNRGMDETALAERGVHIWEPWADQYGNLGPIYGSQWVDWNGDGINQLVGVERSLVEAPDSRRHVVSAWNPSEMHRMALPPCHILFQFYSRPLQSGWRALDLQMYQRSADMVVGVPFNIASYALLLVLMSNSTNHTPGTFTWVGGDCHVYRNHTDAVKEMVRRKHKGLPAPPELEVADPPGTSVTVDRSYSHSIELFHYDPYPKIPVEVAV